MSKLPRLNASGEKLSSSRLASNASKTLLLCEKTKSSQVLQISLCSSLTMCRNRISKSRKKKRLLMTLSLRCQTIAETILRFSKVLTKLETNVCFQILFSLITLYHQTASEIMVVSLRANFLNLKTT